MVYELGGSGVKSGGEDDGGASGGLMGFQGTCFLYICDRFYYSPKKRD